MRYITTLFSLMIVGALGANAWSADPEGVEHQWHQFRGPLGNGVAVHGDPPISWSEETNVQWKVEIPGSGSSTPIIWGERIYLTTAIPTDRIDPNLPKPEDQPERPFGIRFPNRFFEFVVLCLDRQTGETLWQRTANEAVPHEGHHPHNNFASATPTTDGQRLFVPFGSQGYYCYDLHGKRLWNRDLGKVSTRRSFYEASSLTYHDGRVFVCRDNEGQSYLAALDARTGETIWRVDRDEPSAWATPLVVQHEGTTQVVTNGQVRVRSYDFETGDLLWECGGQVSNVTPSPVFADGVVYCMSGYRGSAAQAIAVDSRGDVTGSDRVLWTLNRGTPYVPSPILYRGLLYFTQSNQGILSCVEPGSGETVIERTRMPGIDGIYASPVAAAGRLYFVGRDGTTLVLQHGREMKTLAVNKIDDDVDASPALVGKQLFLRGRKYLYAIARP